MAPTIYFGYGSNMSLSQMASRCPKSEFLGLGRLLAYDWIINEKRYANIVEITPSRPAKDPGFSEVWGLVYKLQESDEQSLDRYEGVPFSYSKVDSLSIDFWPAKPAGNTEKTIDVTIPPRQVEMLSYIDLKRVGNGTPWPEYVDRMNNGIDDALRLGIPEPYIDTILRHWIPKKQSH
jgi:gamma-glutamylcyclotransferase